MNWPWLDKTTNGNTAVALPNVVWESGDLVVPALLLEPLPLPFPLPLPLRLRLLVCVLLVPTLDQYILRILLWQRYCLSALLRLLVCVLLVPTLDQYILKILLWERYCLAAPSKVCSHKIGAIHAFLNLIFGETGCVSLAEENPSPV
jgi:hypothetical protein